MNRIRIALLIVFAVSMAAGIALRPEGAVDESLYLKEVAPGASFGEKGGSPPHYESAQGVVAFNSYDVVPSIKGYAGPIKMLVVLTPDGKIAGLRVLEHRETPNYVHRMDKPEFLGQFLGKSVNDPLELDRDIDGITRATVSVKALTDSVRESSRRVAADVLSLKVVRGDGGRRLGLGWAAYLGLFALAMALYYLSRSDRAARMLQRPRDVVLVLDIAVLGLWLASPFSVLHLLNIAMFRYSMDLLFLVIVISTAASLVLAGRFYCGWLCPFGALSEFLGRLPVRKWRISVQADDWWRNLKYLILGLVVAVVLVSGKTELGNFETYVTLFSFHGTALAWGIVALSLLAGFRVRRFWCRYLCPVAALTGVFARSDPTYPSTADCPMANRKNPLGAECIRCNRCYRRPSGQWIRPFYRTRKKVYNMVRTCERMRY